MTTSHDTNPADAHRFFSASCFNKAWDLIDKPDRTPEEDEQMLLLAQASLWHWTQRADCVPRNLSIGYWQLSRIYALLGQADNARHSAQQSLRHAGEGPFYAGYAYEALARAESVANNREKLAQYLAEARRCAERVADADDKQALEKDLASLA
jgi:hypothetical protein